jgi:hypothetical protein
MQREITELNRLKQIKNRKYSWPGQLAMYSKLVEVTLYLTDRSISSHMKDDQITILNFPRKIILNF